MVSRLKRLAAGASCSRCSSCPSSCRSRWSTGSGTGRFNFQFGIASTSWSRLGIGRACRSSAPPGSCRWSGCVTIWWTAGFSILLFLAGLRAIPEEIYEAGALDSAGRWRPSAASPGRCSGPSPRWCLTIQLILQLKIFDQVYLFSSAGGRTRRWCWCYYVFQRAFARTTAGARPRSRSRCSSSSSWSRCCSSSCCARGGRGEPGRRAALEPGRGGDHRWSPCSAR